MKNSPQNESIALGYIRVSTKDQAENGVSLETQELALKKYFRENSEFNYKIFRDEGKTGRNDNRPGLKNAMQFCQQNTGCVSKFVVYNLSRLCRDVNLQLGLMAQFRTLGIELVSLNEKLEDTAGGTLFTTIVGAFNQFQSDSNSETTRENMLKVRLDGYPTSRPCYGHKICKSGKRSSHIADEPRATYVREAFGKMDSGKYTPKSLLDHMTINGMMTVKGKRMTLQSFMAILSNKSYLGMLKISDSEGWIDTPHVEQLIDKDTFYHVQSILESNRRVTEKVTRSYRSSGFPLTVFVQCACGGKLTGGGVRSGSGERTPYYHCRDKCGASSIRQEELENAFYDLLGRVRPSNGLMKAYSAIVRDVYRSMQGDIKKELRDTNQKIDELQKVVDNMISAQYGSDTKNHLPFEFFTVQVEKRHTEIAQHKDRRDTLRKQVDDFDAVVDGAFNTLAHIDDAWLNADSKIRRAIQHAVFPDGLVYEGNGTFRTPVTSLAFNIIDFIEAPDSQKGPRNEFEQPGLIPAKEP